MDVARVNAIEGDLVRLIERRHDQRTASEGPRPSEEMYEESCRRHAEEQRRQKLAALYVYHEEHIGRLDRTFDVLRAEHEAKRDWAAAALLEHGVNPQALLENGHKESV